VKSIEHWISFNVGKVVASFIVLIYAENCDGALYKQLVDGNKASHEGRMSFVVASMCFMINVPGRVIRVEK